MLVIDFTPEYASQSARDHRLDVFVEARRRGPRRWRGHQGFGARTPVTSPLLRSLGEEFGFEVIALPDMGTPSAGRRPRLRPCGPVR